MPWSRDAACAKPPADSWNWWPSKDRQPSKLLPLLELWIGMITDAYNLATAIAAAPSYDAVRGQVQAERRM